MNIILIQSNRSETEFLSKTLLNLSKEINVNAVLHNLKDSIEYITTHPYPHVIFSDIQLPDGVAFDIFSYTGVSIPVIFITTYTNSELIKNANTAIDYLLKPLKKWDIEKSLLKFQRLKEHFLTSNAETTPGNIFRSNGGRKKRLLVRSGCEHIVLRAEEIVLIYTQNKVVFVLDHFSKKYILDNNLGELEGLLDNTVFFRANRQYIININYIKSFRTFEKVKLLINVDIPKTNHSIVISQITARHFRRWMQEA